MSTQNPPGTGPVTATTQDARETAADLAQTTKDAAGAAARDAAEFARSQAETAKASVADEMAGVASALRNAATEMRNGSPQERTFGQIAEGLADASDAMRDKDLGEMVQDLSRFARRNPMVFLGVAALIGFAATRFAKASRSPRMGAPAHPADARLSPETGPETSHGDRT